MKRSRDIAPVKHKPQRDLNKCNPPRNQQVEVLKIYRDNLIQKQNSTFSSSSSRGSNGSRIPFYMPSNVPQQIFNPKNNSKVCYRVQKDSFKVDQEERMKVRRNLFGREHSRDNVIDRKVVNMIKDKKANLMPRKRLIDNEAMTRFYKSLQVKTRHPTAPSPNPIKPKEVEIPTEVARLTKTMDKPHIVVDNNNKEDSKDEFFTSAELFEVSRKSYEHVSVFDDPFWSNKNDVARVKSVNSTTTTNSSVSSYYR